jgi:hypothetical protein
MTGSFEVRFVLPSGTEPVSSESGNPVIGIEQDRPLASFIYTSPLTSYMGNWTVTFDVVSLRNFFILQVVSIAALASLFIVSMVIAPKSKFLKRLGLPIPSAAAFTLLSINILQFLTLGGFSLRLFSQILFIIEVLLVVGIVAVNILKHRKRDAAQDKSMTYDYE